MTAALNWMDRAACVGYDPEIWFNGRTRELAQQICAGCPVAARCRARGANEYRGVWGGEVQMKKTVGASPTAEYIGHEHGTERGYRKHLSDKTPPCDRCSIAHGFVSAERYAARSA
ncbi:transcriptional regulator WhiB-like [Mycobacterium phage Phayonce]|uniref:WhiB family transcription factor n=1 Tax=Mycobacterium phage Phayonce TaxID=1647302 RepID=A0A0F6WE02_9CAUD|nr:transcriptional regulator WhiB-like [Mycobacterium phage Phayonce]AKF14403.1 WhiB family transcription factor [Mycobacterium phage Phayonce]